MHPKQVSNGIFATLSQKPILIKLLVLGFSVILLLVPFHGLLSTWFGTMIGPLMVWKAWKEILLFLIGLVYIVQVLRDQAFRRWLWRATLNKLITLYILWHVLVVLISTQFTTATIMGLAINLRLVVFFGVAQSVIYYFPEFYRLRKKLIFWPFVVVVGFGLLQLFVLPADFLKHFGYDKNLTIAPYTTIDSQPDAIRIQSTLRGPNPLGAYLVLPLIAVTAWFVQVLRRRSDTSQYRKILMVLSVLIALATVMVLYGSHSRSAWVAIILAAAVWFALWLPRKWRLPVACSVVALAIVGILTVSSLRHTRFVQDVIFHDNPSIGPTETSNSAHRASLISGLKDVTEQPATGCAPGCAGPASFHNRNGARISENYYLQVAQETGIVGLALFIVLTTGLLKELYKNRSDNEVQILLASLIGLSVANIFLHVWADDTLAYVWWGAAGLWFGKYRLEATQKAVPAKSAQNLHQASYRAGQNQRTS